MEFKCEKTVLLEAVSHVQRSVLARSNIQALEGIHVSVKENYVEFESYNLEFGVKTQIPVFDAEVGEIIIPARIFFDICKKLPSEIVEIFSEKLEINIKCAGCDYNIIGLDSSDFPKLPVINNENCIEFPKNIITSLIKQTIFAVGTDENHPIHTGVLIETRNKIVTFVAIDGFRMALRREFVEIENELKIVVPGKTLAEILKLIPNDEMNIKIFLSERYVFFVINKYTIVSRLLEGEFIDYNAAIPDEFTMQARINTRKFIESVERVSLVINDRLKSPVKTIFGENVAKFSCCTMLGKSSDELEIVTDGEPVEIAFNDKFIVDALKNADTDEVFMQFTTSLRPIKIVPTEGDAFLFLVLPVRIRQSD
ncbi:MAG: DNA polymerase III subunit beta [Candidatus Improbicoccus devescovinae]|nr:MAG: DNA polymerase III subunit beta [Candidatus Improbicoccus devescovinae]